MALSKFIFGKLKNKDESQLSEKQKQKIEQRNIRRAKVKKEADDRVKINKLVSKWIEIMAHLGLDNQLDETYTLKDIEVTEYGFKCVIKTAVSLSFAKLEEESMIKIIQDNIQCIFIPKRGKRGMFEAQFITEDIGDKKYTPIPIEPYETLLGITIDGEPFLVSMLKYPHILIQGATNMGKTKMIDCIITNLITECTPNEVSLYFIQVDKGDQIPYRKCKHTRAYADDIYKALAVTNYLKELIDYRNKILLPFIEDGICGNIYGYNKICKKYKQEPFTYMYLIIDEYSSLMPTESHQKEVKAIKTAIQDNMERLIQIGRFCGLYIIIGLQRATVDKLPSFIKAMSNTTSTFKVNNEKSSYVAIDSNEAVNLNPREAIVKTTERVMLKTYTLTETDIVKHILPFRYSNAEYKEFPFNSFTKLDQILENIKGKPTKKERKEKRDRDNSKNKTENSTNYTNTKIELSKEELKKIEKQEEKLKTIKENTPTETKINEGDKKITETKNKTENIEIVKHGEHFIEGYIPPEKQPNMIIRDEAKIDLSKTTKPPKTKKGVKLDDN